MNKEPKYRTQEKETRNKEQETKNNSRITTYHHTPFHFSPFTLNFKLNLIPYALNQFVVNFTYLQF